jgi:Xaa-Pro aminopeptidase
MLTMHPTLLVGPADWDPGRMPKQEFLARIAALFAACDPAVAGVVVYGDPRSHAELAYLTHMTPKLEACVALIPRAGAPRLLVGGGANMVGSAQRLTWIETLAPLREAGATIARWRDELGGALVLLNGDAMPLRLHQGIARALGALPVDATDLTRREMRRKRTRELPMIQDACDALDAAFSAMRAAQRDRKGMTDTVLVGEAAAWRRGAQDVRTLFGRDGRLAPFTMRDDAVVDPLHVYAAVRHGGYWAEGFDVLSQSPQPAAEAARKILDQAVAHIRAGVTHRQVAEFLSEAIGAGRAHPLTERGFGHHIGLGLDEPDCLTAASTDAFALGDVYTVRAGLRDAGESALVSTMVAVANFSGHIRKWPRGRA